MSKFNPLIYLYQIESKLIIKGIFNVKNANLRLLVFSLPKNILMSRREPFKIDI